MSVLAMNARYLVYGVPHEFLGPEYKASFEGDYDFSKELVDSFKSGEGLPFWSQTFSGPLFVFTGNLHVAGQALLYFFTNNQALSIKICQVLYFILAGISMFLLALHLYKKWFIALFCALIYTFTPFFIGEMLSYLHYSSTYFCLPLAYFFILKALDSERFSHYSVAASFVIAFSFLSHPQNIFIAGLFYFLFAAGILLLQKGRRIKALKALCLAGVLALLLCLFYLLPTLLDGYPYTRSLDEGGTWLSPANRAPGQHSHWHSQTLLSAVTMFHWAWFITPLKSAKYPSMGFMLIYFIPFALFVRGLFLLLKSQSRDRLILFLFLGVISFLLSMGMRAGRLDLFSLAYKFLPFFHMARTPSRYFYQAVLSVCLLSGLAFYNLSRIKSAVLFIVVVSLYLCGANYYGNNYNWTFIPSEEPKYFSQVQGWLKENNTSRHRVIESFCTPSALGLNQRMLPNGLDLLIRNLNKDYLDKYLSLFGFKYILAPALHCRRQFTFDKFGYTPPRADDGYEDLWDEEEYYSAMTTEFRFVYDSLKSDRNFNLHTAGTKDVAIFENKSAFDNYQLYPARGIVILGGSNGYDFLGLERFQKYFDDGLRVAPIFIAQSSNLQALEGIKRVSDELILHNTSCIDLFFLLNQRYLVFLSRLENPGWIFAGKSFGILQPVPFGDHSLGNFVFGDLSLAGSSIATDKKGAICNAPIEIEEEGFYRIMLRVYGGANFAGISVYLDGKPLNDVNPWQFRGFHWIEILSSKLSAGRHYLVLEVRDKGPVFLDAVAVVPGEELQAGIDRAYKRFDGLKLTSMINEQNILRVNHSAGTDLYMAESGFYDFTFKFSSSAQEKRSGRINLSIDSKSVGLVVYDLEGFGSSVRTLKNVSVLKGGHSLVLKNIMPDTRIDFIAVSNSEDASQERGGGGLGLKFDYIQKGSSCRGALSSDEPLLLVHTEANYPGWQMRVPSGTVRPIITNMFMNGFILEGEGERAFNIYYLNFWQMLGVVVSLGTLVVVVFLALLRKRRCG